MMTGGFSETKPATPEVQHITDEVKPQFEMKVNKICDVFQALLYRTQVVAGTNYLIKVQAAKEEYVHLKVFQALPFENQGPKLEAFQTGKTRDDPLTYF
ncbi:Cystatin-A [Mesitornis unicolor]|uniref:cystatin-A-like n=1 Tax=Mesitornis unicolor TaxID=54374 RepID=UPI0005281D6F|nr:PREDICTED: cystatin-A-like [Mesitornis unicolor]KFQ20181.1 Cystatin-A [Mesitornis unicolor]